MKPYFSPWTSYLKNNLVVLITLFGLCSIMAVVIPQGSSSVAADIASVLFSGIAAISLSGFILVGLQSIKKEAGDLHDEIEKWDTKAVKDIQTEVGMTSTALRLQR